MANKDASEEDKVKSAARVNKWRLANLEKSRAAVRQWRIDYPDRAIEYLKSRKTSLFAPPKLSDLLG